MLKEKTLQKKDFCKQDQVEMLRQAKWRDN